MVHSTKARRKQKATERPDKPRPDFPLFPHRNGRWAKKVLGKFCYFGKWADDPKGIKAEKLWKRRREDLLAGRVPESRRRGLKLKDLCNRFLTAKKHLLDTGEITAATFRDYKETTDRMIAYWGRHRIVDHLGPDDFRAFRAHLAKGWGPTTLGNEIIRCRVVFKFAADEGLIPHTLSYGQAFSKPSRKVMRKHKAANGIKMFDAAELRSIGYAARQPLAAMIALALNGGMGNTDMSELPLATLQAALKTGWLDFPRPKTGVSRRIPLWPETIEACREALDQRAKPSSPDHAWRAFLTRRGAPWVNTTDSVSQEFVKLLKRPRCPRCGMIEKASAKKCSGCQWAPRGDETWGSLHRRGVSFYTLRRVFQTVASNETGDEVATSAIMGHAPRGDDMASVYRQRVDDDRLQRVTLAVRTWLFGKKAAK